MELLSLRNASKSFQDHDKKIHAVSNISLDIFSGEMVAIIGPSGSGKTTLLNLMGVVSVPDLGEVFVNGQTTSNLSDTKRCQIRNHFFGYIVQDFALIEEDTAMQNILVPTLYSKQKRTSTEYRFVVEDLANKLQVKDKLKTKVKNLSGGERQRIAIIRSLVCNQQIILADEPTGSLDEENANIVIEFLRELVNKENKTVVIVTHDLNIAKRCDRIFKLTHGTLSAF